MINPYNYTTEKRKDNIKQNKPYIKESLIYCRNIATNKDLKTDYKEKNKKMILRRKKIIHLNICKLMI